MCEVRDAVCPRCSAFFTEPDIFIQGPTVPLPHYEAVSVWFSLYAPSIGDTGMVPRLWKQYSWHHRRNTNLTYTFVCWKCQKCAVIRRGKNLVCEEGTTPPAPFFPKLSSCGVAVSPFSSPDLSWQNLLLLECCLPHHHVKETVYIYVVRLKLYIYIYNKYSRKADKRWSSSFFFCGASATSSPYIVNTLTIFARDRKGVSLGRPNKTKDF